MAADTRVVRFGRTERHLHTIHGAGFTAMLATGLVLYVPFLAQIVSDRPLVKAAHLVAAVTWLTALVLVGVVGDRTALQRTRREIERLDGDDIRWLRHRKAPQGRFNAGQKLHAAVQAGLALLFVVSGVLLWLGEHDTTLRLPGTLALHDAAMFLGGMLVSGHVYIALSKPGALGGIVRGTVSKAYAREHHPKWAQETPTVAATLSFARLAVTAVVVALGIAAAALLVGG
jgi:formate dehydrogenase subunit gamma